MVDSILMLGLFATLTDPHTKEITNKRTIK